MHSTDAGDRKKASEAGSDLGKRRRQRKGCREGSGQSRRNMKQTWFNHTLLHRQRQQPGNTDRSSRFSDVDSIFLFAHPLTRFHLSLPANIAVAVERHRPSRLARRLLTGIHYYCICIPLIAYLNLVARNSDGIYVTVLDIAWVNDHRDVHRGANTERSLTERMATSFNSSFRGKKEMLQKKPISGDKFIIYLDVSFRHLSVATFK